MTGLLAILALTGCEHQFAPLPECGPDDWCQVRRTYDVVCALRGDGSPTCWGENHGFETEDEAAEYHADHEPDATNDWGQVSLMPQDARFRQLEFNRTATTVCGLTLDGGVRCWGELYEELSQLDPPVPFVQLAVGADHACAITELGDVECWGEYLLQDYADFSFEGEFFPPASLAEATAVAAGDTFSCALHDGGQLACWGILDPDSFRDHGQVSDAPQGQRFQNLGAQRDTAWAQDLDGAWVSWGDQSWCDVGDPLCRTSELEGDPPQGLVALDADELVQFSAVTPACGLDGGGVLHCSGDEFGPGVPPLPVPFSYIDYSLADSFCGVTAGFSLICWGSSARSDFDGQGTRLVPEAEDTAWDPTDNYFGLAD